MAQQHEQYQSYDLQYEQSQELYGQRQQQQAALKQQQQEAQEEEEEEEAQAQEQLLQEVDEEEGFEEAGEEEGAVVEEEARKRRQRQGEGQQEEAAQSELRQGGEEVEGEANEREKGSGEEEMGKVVEASPPPDVSQRGGMGKRYKNNGDIKTETEVVLEYMQVFLTVVLVVALIQLYYRLVVGGDIARLITTPIYFTCQPASPVRIWML